MKMPAKFLISALLPALLFVYSSCKKDKDADPTPQDIQLGKLSATWNLDNVTLDGVSKKTDYANFKLTISGTPGSASYGYSTTGRPTNSPWAASGNWTFGTDPESQIIRDAQSTSDKLDMGYAVSDASLQLTFNFNGVGYPGRASNVKGNWVFTFKK
jgi:hypothetical protein